MLFNNIIKYIWNVIQQHHQIPLGQKPAFFRCIEYLVQVLISYSPITSFATSIVFTQQITFMWFPKAKLWEDDALHLIYWKLALREDHNF